MTTLIRKRDPAEANRRATIRQDPEAAAKAEKEREKEKVKVREGEVTRQPTRRRSLVIFTSE